MHVITFFLKRLVNNVDYMYIWKQHHVLRWFITFPNCFSLTAYLCQPLDFRTKNLKTWVYQRHFPQKILRALQ